MSCAPVSRLGFFEVRTRDVARLVSYYEDVLGLHCTERSDTAAYLTTGTDHHCVVVAEGEPQGRARLGYALACGLDDAAAALAAAGLEVERRTDAEPGLAEVLVVSEPMTATPLWLYVDQAASGAGAAPAFRPARLGHLAGYVPDLARIRAFYEEALDFRWADSVGEFFVFLRCNRDHHAVNFLQSTTRTGLFHVAFEMRDFLHLKEVLDQLARHRLALDWGPGRHGPGHNVFTYHRDPDGNIVELFCDLDVVGDERTGHWEPRPWHETMPLGPKVYEPTDFAANMWGPQNPDPDFLAR